MATYEITVSTSTGEYPKVVGIRRLGFIRALWTRFVRWRRHRDGSDRTTLEGCGNADMAGLQTVDIAMDVPCACLRKEILEKLSGTSSPDKVRLVFCLPTGRRPEPDKAVEI